jgi:hypothetical protein
MDPRFTLPAELIEGASVSGNEYGWPPEQFPHAVLLAESLGYACIGGQFQFQAPVGTCEMYWLNADSTERLVDESWSAYCARSRSEVMEKFQQIIAKTDFMHEARQWSVLESEIERGFDVIQTLFFVAYFVSEVEWKNDQANRLKS